MNTYSFGDALETCLTEGLREPFSISTKTIIERSAGIGSIVKDSHEVESHNKFNSPIEAIILDRSIKWNRPLIIAIDDFQVMKGHWDEKKNKGSHRHVRILRNLLLGSYHKPIMLVLGGLCDAPDKLYEFGINRLPNEKSPHWSFQEGLCDE